MLWFKHDSDAATDGRLKKIILRYGTDGYAIYFHCLELIAGDISDSNITFELEHDSEVIADNLKVKSHIPGQSAIDRVQEIMRYIIDLGLFEETSGRVSCIKMLKRLDTSMTSNSRFRAIIVNAKESHDTVMIESCQSHDTIMLDKIRIDKKEIIKEVREEARCFGKSIPVNDGTTRITKAQSAWNYAELKPPSRIMAMQFKGDDLSGCLAVIQAYSDGQIQEAIQNYSEIKNSTDYEMGFEYGSFQGFMKSGVEKFVSEADPFERYRKSVSEPARQKASEGSYHYNAADFDEEGNIKK